MAKDIQPDNAEHRIWHELDIAAKEYVEAKEQFDTARVRFEVAKRRLEVTKQLASEVMTKSEWASWLAAHSTMKFHGMPLGEAIRRYIEDETRRFYENHFEDREIGTPIYRLEDIRRDLARGGFEFRTLTPLREINAALIHLAGVKKVRDWYEAEDAEAIANAVIREQLEQ